MKENKPLIESLGSAYMNDWFMGALFQEDNLLYKFKGVDAQNLYVAVTDLSQAKLTWKSTKLDSKKLTSFSQFSYPKLGYRQDMTKKGLSIVSNYSSTRSSYRGLRSDTVVINWLPVVQTLLLAKDSDGYNRDLEIIDSVYRPKFTSFPVGLASVVKGEQCCFAVSEDLAVGMNCANTHDNPFYIYFRGRVVGSITSTGDVEITNKILNRPSVKRKLFS